MGSTETYCPQAAQKTLFESLHAAMQAGADMQTAFKSLDRDLLRQV